MDDYLNQFNQISDDMLNLYNAQNRYEIDTKTLEQNEKIALAQLDLAEREYYSNVDIMNRNFGLQQQAYNYNKQQAEITRMREDNAFQRRVADTVKAGFSPLATEGVASSSQSPTLTAPQLDPQGVNQATTNRLNAYNSKLQQNNTTEQLRLQSQQLKLAQIDTVTEIIKSAQQLRSQNIINQRNLEELKWYKIHGFRDTTLDTLFSDILKGVNVNGKNLSQLSTDGINFALDKILNNSSNKEKYGTGSSFFNFLSKSQSNSKSKDKIQDYTLSDKQQSSLFKNLSNARKGLLSPIEIDKLNFKLHKYFGFDFGLDYGRWKSLSQTEYENILKQITERLR